MEVGRRGKADPVALGLQRIRRLIDRKIERHQEGLSQPHLAYFNGGFVDFAVPEGRHRDGRQRQEDAGLQGQVALPGFPVVGAAFEVAPDGPRPPGAQTEMVK